MTTTIKVAVSLPKVQFRLMEHQRRLMKVSRSTAVREALTQWLTAMQEQDAIQHYVEGYQRSPESIQEAERWGQAQAQALATSLDHETW